jgi:hypothetical protein
MSRRRFGRVRRLPSGRWQARYQGPDSVDRAAPETFGTKTDAEVWLTLKEAEIRRGDWIDPDAGKVRFGGYSDNWVNDSVLKPRTEELYWGLLKTISSPPSRISISPTSARPTYGAGARSGSSRVPSRNARSGRLQSPRRTGCCIPS